MKNLKNVQLSMIKLFNKAIDFDNKSNQINQYSLFELIKSGVVINPNILRMMSSYEQGQFVDEVINQYGLSEDELRSSLYKKFSDVEDSNDLELFVTQLLHYITGYSNLDYAYEPDLDKEHEIFNQFEKNNQIEINQTFRYIETVSIDEAKDQIQQFIERSMPLSEKDIRSILELITTLFNTNEIIEFKIGNKELNCVLFDQLNQKYNLSIVPKDAVEFLRYAIYKVTNDTQLIKSKQMIDFIKSMLSYHQYDNETLNLFKLYEKDNGLIPLAEIFNRYKPLFLALKNNQTKSIINKISRLSKKHHKPMQIDILANAVNLIETNKITQQTLFKYINDKQPDLYQIVKLINAIRLRGFELYSVLEKNNVINNRDNISFDKQININEDISRVYKIRNGSTFIKSIEDENNQTIKDTVNLAYRFVEIDEMLTDFLVKQINKNLKDCIVLYDENESRVNIKMPTSTKSFVGHLPEFSSITLSGNTSLGVTWNKECDIDLSCFNLSTREYVSWRSYQRDFNDLLMHSGDMIRLNKHGYANETVFIDDQIDDNLSFNLVLFSSYQLNQKEVDYKLALSENVDKSQYANINNVQLNLPLFISNQGEYIVQSFKNDDSREFVLTSTNTGQSTVTNNSLSDAAIQAIVLKKSAYLDIEEIIDKCDCFVARNDDEYRDFKQWDESLKAIDLRPQTISKNDVLKFLE